MDGQKEKRRGEGRGERREREGREREGSGKEGSRVDWSVFLSQASGLAVI